MGHQIEHQITQGNCQLTQCSCGRGALKVKGKTILLSASDIGEIAKLFGFLEKNEPLKKLPLVDRLNGLTEGKPWADFSLPE